jgi:hypothetical protein
MAMGAGPFRWGRALRFAVALFAALLIGGLTFVLLAKIAPLIAISSAIGASLVAAYCIAPTKQRVLAAWTMLGFAGLVAAGIFLNAAITGTLKIFDYFLLLSVGVAAIIGRAILRPVKDSESAPPARSNLTKPEKVLIAPAPRTDPAVHHLWRRPQTDSTENSGP